LLHALSPSGHFTKHVASPNRSLSVVSWAFASVIVVAAVKQSIDKISAIFWQFNMTCLSLSPTTFAVVA
jgi:hypothetical protein